MAIPVPGLVASLPKTVWIELTSKCPFDCIFCTRKQERGNGQHMSFPLYESLVNQLERPEVIRLNYSGESIHYPQLAAAIRLARGTGATTELVSALGSATEAAVEGLVDAGLHRLSVSIHSMDEGQFRRIYGWGELGDLRNRVAHLLGYKARRGSRYPELDVAFVAMEQNLGELERVVGYADSLGVTQVSIHPVIERGAGPRRFPDEVDEEGRLRGGFEARVRVEAERVAGQRKHVAISVARPVKPRGVEEDRTITTCEQNPWDTMHVLANGSVVVCEVQDRTEMGNLQHQTLAEVWNGPAYEAFRRRYLDGSHPVCQGCPWRRSVPVTAGRNAMVRGWHPQNGETVEWSEASAAMAVGRDTGAVGMRLTGLLPPGLSGENSLSIRQGAENVFRVVNGTEGMLAFEAAVPLAELTQFEVEQRFCPAERGEGGDIRNLGFALTGLRLEYGAERKEAVRRLLDRLEWAEGWHRWRWARPAAKGGSGISVVVPSRDTPDILGATLRGAAAALARVEEAGELVVVVSGAEEAGYAGLRREFPKARWLFRAAALDYGAAIAVGLGEARYGWVYLLNSDMALQDAALVEVMALRRDDVFAIGSRIRMEDGSGTESNWTDLRYLDNDAAELVERDPEGLEGPHGCLYVGGGSGLFRASLLRRWARRTRVYAPFYWEDVEWGALAWRHGYRCVFCPASEAVHGRRQTISRYYSEAEVTRVFERNRMLFHLRNLGGVRRLEERLRAMDARSWGEIYQRGWPWATMLARREGPLLDEWNCERL